ncbi:MAG: OsmC family protein [Actinomycetia bacterium]|nr:OsmC family protein [Actinomycetes bacterium]
MADLTFTIAAAWAGTGPEGEGAIRAGDQQIRYSAPASMGGKGVGTNPEELLLSAVTACYSATLYRVLTSRRLPVARLALRADGLVENYPDAARFSRIVVHPTVEGGDPARTVEYEAAAHRARDLCFIGRTVRDSLDYAVGTVDVRPA